MKNEITYEFSPCQPIPHAKTWGFSWGKFKGYGGKWGKSVTGFAVIWGGSKSNPPQITATFDRFSFINQYTKKKPIYI